MMETAVKILFWTGFIGMFLVRFIFIPGPKVAVGIIAIAVLGLLAFFSIVLLGFWRASR